MYNVATLEVYLLNLRILLCWEYK